MTIVNSLKYFNLSTIYPGSNLGALQKIEAWIDLVKTNTGINPSLGLFGPASTGKTVISNEIGKILKLPVIAINGNSLDTEKELAILLNGSGNTIQRESPHRLSVKTIFFIDESHSINKKIQTSLLSFLEDRIYRFNDYFTIDYSNCIFIFATTDSSKMLQPLVTRLYSVTLNQYTTEDVSNIVQNHIWNVDTEASLLTAKIAKNIPREAITHTKIALSKTNKVILEKSDVIAYLNSIGLDNDGLDSTDHLLLTFLKESSKNTIKKSKQLEYLFNLEIIKELENETQLTSAKKLQKRKAEIAVENYNQLCLTSLEYQPRSRQDISLGCRLYDTRDLEIRLSYLEFLNKIEKTSRGIRYVDTG